MTCTLGFATTATALDCSDAMAATWLLEVLRPWFMPCSKRGQWLVRVSTSLDTFEDLNGSRPQHTEPRNCFAHDTQLIALPAWSDREGLILADDERHCFLKLAPACVDLIGDPSSRRWRFTLMWLFHEIAATQLRHTHLDLHAAAVGAGDRGLLIVGPKGAGKTTLSFHLLRTGLCQWIANDRVFATASADRTAILGVPTAVKIRPGTAAEFPELRRSLPDVERPYLYTLAELDRLPATSSAPAHEYALSPAQLTRQLGVEPLASVVPGAIVFPHIHADTDGWLLEPLDPEAARVALAANQYGRQRAQQVPTIFETLDPAPAHFAAGLSAALSRNVAAYRLHLGPNAYSNPDFAAQLLRRLGLR